jgi:hypothetical protein
MLGEAVSLVITCVLLEWIETDVLGVIPDEDGGVGRGLTRTAINGTPSAEAVVIL